MRCKCGFDTNIAGKIIQYNAEQTKWKCPQCLEWNDYEKQAACEHSELDDLLCEKPPIGLSPKWSHERLRGMEICEAMHRYVEARKPIPQAWIDELQTLWVEA